MSRSETPKPKPESQELVSNALFGGPQEEEEVTLAPNKQPVVDLKNSSTHPDQDTTTEAEPIQEVSPAVQASVGEEIAGLNMPTDPSLITEEIVSYDPDLLNATGPEEPLAKKVADGNKVLAFALLEKYLSPEMREIAAELFSKTFIGKVLELSHHYQSAHFAGMGLDEFGNVIPKEDGQQENHTFTLDVAPKTSDLPTMIMESTVESVCDNPKEVRNSSVRRQLAYDRFIKPWLDQDTGIRTLKQQFVNEVARKSPHREVRDSDWFRSKEEATQIAKTQIAPLRQEFLADGQRVVESTRYGISRSFTIQQARESMPL